MSSKLSDFARSVRMDELQKLLDGADFKPAEVRAVNTHIHTFYSYNVEGISPTEVLYRSKEAGIEVAGIVDFDVLDAMDEAFEVSELLKLPTVVALESRVYVEDYADRDINSPGESGVLYFMGTGFTELPVAGSAAHATLKQMRDGARDRNIALLDRLESTLAPLVIDYKKDVCTLTPADNATERHILEALDVKSRAVFAGGELAEYWSERLVLSIEDTVELLADAAKFRNTIRAKLMKRGGVGYKQPDASTFPALSQVISMIEDLQALPCWAWVDGSSAGESDAEELCDYMVSAGTRALAIIPERNWHFADPEVRAQKVKNLSELVAAGKKRNLVFTVGTEMNNYGQPFVDDFSAPELAPFVDDFLAGAYILYGHTLLQRAAYKGMMSPWAKEKFGSDFASANRFYQQIGEAATNPRQAREVLVSLADYDDLELVIEAVGR